jgi:hypothetical protein
MWLAFPFWSLSHTTQHYKRGREGQQRDCPGRAICSCYTNHPFLLLDEYCIHLWQWPLLHSITVVCLKALVPQKDVSGEIHFLNSLPERNFCSCPVSFYTFSFPFSFSFFLSGELRAHFCPQGLITLSYTSQTTSQGAVDHRTPHLSWELHFWTGMRQLVFILLQLRTVKCLGRLLSWSHMESGSLRPTQSSGVFDLVDCSF